MNFLVTAFAALVWVIVFVAVLILIIGLVFLYLLFKYGKESVKDKLRKNKEIQ